MLDKSNINAIERSGTMKLSPVTEEEEADNFKCEKPHQKKLEDCASKANEESMSNTFNDICHQQFSKIKEK